MAKSTTIKLMVDGEMEECLVRIDKSGEYVCKSTSGRFFFFPKDSDLREEVKRHNAANSEKPIFADDARPEDDEEWDNWGTGDEKSEDEDGAEAAVAEDDESEDEE